MKECKFFSKFITKLFRKYNLIVKIKKDHDGKQRKRKKKHYFLFRVVSTRSQKIVGYH